MVRTPVCWRCNGASKAVPVWYKTIDNKIRLFCTPCKKEMVLAIPKMASEFMPFRMIKPRTAPAGSHAIS